MRNHYTFHLSQKKKKEKKRETITHFRNSWLKKGVICYTYNRYTLNSYLCIIMIVFKCLCMGLFTSVEDVKTQS